MKSSDGSATFESTCVDKLSNLDASLDWESGVVYFIEEMLV